MGYTKRALQISDGLASMAHKRIKALIGEFKNEGVLTTSESQAALKRLGQAKSNIYDAMSRELKRVLLQTAKARPKHKSKSRKSR